MIKNFNSLPMLKSSENCDKFSKSVSYETLVGGTATIGTEIKQTRWLFLSSAVKPLTAVGTLTSLLCNSAKVVEKLLRHVITRRTSVRRGYLPEQGTHANKESLFASVTWLMRLPRRIQRMLLRMTIPALAFLLSLNLSTAFAEITCTKDGTKLTIGGSGTFDGCPNYSQRTATEVTIGTGITKIGDYTFLNASSLTSITIPDSVTSIGDQAFYGASSLTSITIPDSVTSIGGVAFAKTGLKSITIPDSVTSIGQSAFSGAKSLTSITIPDSVTSLGSSAFWNASSLESIIIPDNIDTKNWSANAFLGLPEGTKNIVCQGDLNKCYEKLAKYFTYETCPQNLKDAGKCTCSSGCIDSGLVQEATQKQCGGEYIWDENYTPKCRHMKDDECTNSAQYYINNGQCKSMPGSKTKCKNADFLWSESSCVKSCASGFVEWDKECLSEYPFAKKRWTPAEANEWLHDGNDNFVVITFKK